MFLSNFPPTIFPYFISDLGGKSDFLIYFLIIVDFVQICVLFP